MAKFNGGQMTKPVSPSLARYRKNKDEINARRRKLYAEDEWYRNKEKKRHHEKYLKKIKENNVAKQDSKRSITEELNRLKIKGFDILTFNKDNFVDFILVSKKFIVYVKIFDKKLPDEQKRIMQKLSSASVWNKNTHVKYLKIKKDAERLTDFLLKSE